MNKILKNLIDIFCYKRQIFGDTKFAMYNDECRGTNEEKLRCAQPEVFTFVYIYTMFYFVIANILLLNLLIAMFRFVLFCYIGDI